jgi:hypothetical protein
MRWFWPLAISLLGSPTFAQSSVDVASLYSSSDIIFTGHLEKIGPSPKGLSARFKVDQSIKGRASTEKPLRAELPSESRCHELEENHAYLIYARTVGEALWIDPCEGSKLLSAAEDDLRYIHNLNPKVSERCSREHLDQLAAKSPIIATAAVVGTADSMGTTLDFRPWCGLVLTTEDAYYDVRDVLKGKILDPKIVVEHPICWDTVTVDGYDPSLSPELFRDGNVLLLFLKKVSHQPDKQVPAPFKSVYEDLDENCGAVMADMPAAQSAAETVRARR